MRIITILPDLTPGGISKICIELCAFLSKSNEVFLISLCGYEKDRLPLPILGNGINFIGLNKKPGFSLLLLWDTYKQIKILKPDILHTHSQGLFYSILYIMALPNTRFFYTIHSLADKDASFLYRVFYKLLFKYFRVKAIPISYAVQKSFSRVYKLKSERVIYHGTNLPFRPENDAIIVNQILSYKKTGYTGVFITLARISEEKNQRLLIESFNKLTKDGIDILLLIIGNSTGIKLLDELKELAGPNIYFLGRKNNVEEYLKLADAFCLTSVYEGLSLATIEALAMKVIPICTPVGGVPEVVQDGYNGILSEDCTVISYVNALNRFLTMSEQEKQEMRDNAFRTYKERFTIEKCGEEHLKLYNAALQRKL